MTNDFFDTQVSVQVFLKLKRLPKNIEEERSLSMAERDLNFEGQLLAKSLETFFETKALMNLKK